MPGVFKAAPRSVIHWDSRDAAHSCISKGKRHMDKSLEETRYKLPHLLPVEWFGTHLIPPAMSSVNTCKVLSTKEAL